MLKLPDLAIFKNIETFFFKRRTTATAHSGVRKGHTLQTAKSIMLLFDATHKAEITAVQEQRDIWVNEGKKVEMVGFDASKKAESTKTEHFTKLSPKDFNWAKVLKDKTPKPPLDGQLLLCFNPKKRREIHYLASISKAEMKVGTTTETNLPQGFDLIIELPKDAGVQVFFENLKLYLNKITQAKL